LAILHVVLLLSVWPWIRCLRIHGPSRHPSLELLVMKITFNIDKERFEEHTFNLAESTILFASFISGISFWIIAAVMLFDPSYQ
jgi:hypothetical protein